MTPLTAMKFAELTVKAGFPPGVINVLPGKGQAIPTAPLDVYTCFKVVVFCCFFRITRCVIQLRVTGSNSCAV